MKALRDSSFSRRLIVAVMLLSWLVITNHCALGLMREGEKAAEPAHCHAARGDAGKKAPAGGICECCRKIKVNLSGKARCKFDESRFERHSYAIIAPLAAPVTDVASGIFLDHGPPRAESFAETVLQRSLLSHAPPILA